MVEEFWEKGKERVRGKGRGGGGRGCGWGVKNKKSIGKRVNFEGIFMGSFWYSFLCSFWGCVS